MPLVSVQDFAKLLKIDKVPLFGNLIGRFVLYVTQLKKANQIYDRNKHKSGIEYLNSLLKEYNICVKISKDDLCKIPNDDAFITVSNHPLGGVDGILLLTSVLSVRKDFKVVANFLLQRQKPIKDYIFPVNPFDHKKSVKSSVHGLIDALKHLESGKPLGIFPAGEVSTIKERNIYVDKPWDNRAIRIIKKANVPVVPIYFHAKNSMFFYFLAKINPILRTLKLPSELNNKSGKIIYVKVGNVIDSKTILSIPSVELLNHFLRAKTYLLSKSFLRNKRSIKLYRNSFKKVVKNTISLKTQMDICEEINALRLLNKRLFASNEYEVFFTKANGIPNLMNEIGRLREITFRLIGEGTNNKSDNDKYDNYYHHLILWNNKKQKFVGAYRMGLGKEVYQRKGVNSFYMSNFFNFSTTMHDKLIKTIEMGRAFIVPDYQQKPMPLFLLWKGIAAVTIKHPEYEYLMGGVTITNWLTTYSKSAIIYFLDQFYCNKDIKEFVTSKNPYKTDLTTNEKAFIDTFINGNVKKLSKIINEVEEGKLKMPVLIKQYIKQNAKFVDYNVDRNFNNAIDALIFMKISEIPGSTQNPILKDFDKA